VRSRLLIAAVLALALSAGAVLYLIRRPDPAASKPSAESSLSVDRTEVATGKSALPSAPSETPPPPAPAVPPPLPAGLAPLAEPTLYRSDTAATEVFRRAFWREPTPADRIVHAERREWVGERDGVRRWQWFLILDPGPELATWLRDRNPFGLAPAAPADLRLDPASQPAWFPAAALPDAEYFLTSDSAMVMLREKASGRLYVSDHGHGFAAPSPAPAAAPAPGRGLVPGSEIPLRIPGDVRPASP